MQAYLPPHSDRPLHLGEAPTLHLAPLRDRIRLLQNDLETRPLTPDQVGGAWREIAHELAHYESAYRHDPARRHLGQTDLLDLDQHILIAAANIGFGLSLKQSHERQADASAIGALRHMAEVRKKDFHLHQ